MADGLATWLETLPAAARDRIARTLMGSGSENDSLDVKLADDAFLGAVIEGLSDRELRALEGLAAAGVPVLRADVTALAKAGDDPVEALADRALVVPVRTGRGMPTHVALTPPLADRIRRHLDAARTTGLAPVSADHAARRRRFEFALLFGSIAQHPPRMTRAGQLHTGDLGKLSEQLAGTSFASTKRIERTLAKLLEQGAVTPSQGRLELVPPAATDVGGLFLRLALAEFGAPSLPDLTRALLSRALTHERVPVIEAVRELEAGLLRERSTMEDQARRGARKELSEALLAALDATGVLVLSRSGTPLAAESTETLARLAQGEELSIAIDPAVRATLQNAPVPATPHRAGFVQGSFEVVADVACDPSLVVRIGLCAELVRADHAATFRITKTSIARAAALGTSQESILADLRIFSSKDISANVARMVVEWHPGKVEPAPVPIFPAPALDGLLDDARRALDVAAGASRP